MPDPHFEGQAIPTSGVHEMDKFAANDFAKLLEALADPSRLRILIELKDRPLSVSEIGKLLEITVVNVSHHLQTLKNSNILLAERQGRSINYRLNPNFFKLEDGKLRFVTAWCEMTFIS
jgi:ArsR family transcriptional regulator, nickel/cobalt-responsive transcriptional repressor